jgi:GcrA cell cycle regulator
MIKLEWTAQMDTRLRQLHQDGLSYRRIAEQLNAELGLDLTKNACVGRGHRLGLPLRAEPGKPGRPLKMIELTPRTCRWPEGDQPPYSYCGAPVYRGGAFCLRHCQLAYIAPAKRWV